MSGGRLYAGAAALLGRLQDYAEVRPRIKGRFVSPEEYAAYKAQQAGGRGAQHHDQVVPGSK